MRKSTVVALGILVFAFAAMIWLFHTYTQEFVIEIRHAKELTDELRPRLAPDSRIRLARARGAARYLVADDHKYGLLVEVSPRRESFATDATGVGLALEIATRAFERYDAERPIDWVEVRVTKPDGTVGKPMGFVRGDGDVIEPIRGTVPPAPGATPPPPATPKPALPGAPDPGMSPPGAPPSPPPAPPTVPPVVPSDVPPPAREGPAPAPAPVPGMAPDGAGGRG